MAGRQSEGAVWDPEFVAADWPTASESQAISRRRRDLYEAMREVESAVAAASGWPGWRGRVKEALQRMQASLQAHVEETEAADGLFADIVERSPRLVSAIDDLRREHVEILDSCSEALQAVSEDVSSERVRRRVNVLLGKLAMHRQTGAEMLYEAFMTDIGAAD